MWAGAEDMWPQWAPPVCTFCTVLLAQACAKETQSWGAWLRHTCLKTQMACLGARAAAEDVWLLQQAAPACVFSAVLLAEACECVQEGRVGGGGCMLCDCVTARTVAGSILHTRSRPCCAGVYASSSRALCFLLVPFARNEKPAVLVPAHQKRSPYENGY